MTGAPRVALTLTQVAHRVPGGTATSSWANRHVGRHGEVDLTAVWRGELRRPTSVCVGRA
jgi:hypothetical protein